MKDPVKQYLLDATSARKALELQETAEEAHANCEECDGEEVPELCPKCFPLYDEARLARRSALGLNARPPGTVGTVGTVPPLSQPNPQRLQSVELDRGTVGT